MSFIRSSQSVIFDGAVYITAHELHDEVAYLTQGYKDEGIAENSVCLLQNLNPLETIKALLALLYLKATVCLLNPKLPDTVYTELLSELGPYHSVDHLTKGKTKQAVLDIDLDKVSLLLATSGSMGKPKLIAQTMRNWTASVRGSLAFFNAKSYEPWILNLPLFHVSGLSIVFRAFMSHAPLVIAKDALYRHNCRFSMIPHMLQVLADNGKLDGYLKAQAILIGGAKLHEALFEKIRHLPIYLSYGMTEACAQVTGSDKSPKSLTEGKPLPGREIALSETQEILLKGEAICDFYWKRGQLYPLKNTLGFYASGDLGHLATNTDLTTLGRKDERIEIKGEKIFPAHLENCLMKHFDFKKLIVTHVHDVDQKTLIVAFCSPLPTLQERGNMKAKVGSLFFPTYFFELESSSLQQKILLKELKAKALKLIFDR